MIYKIAYYTDARLTPRVAWATSQAECRTLRKEIEEAEDTAESFTVSEIKTPTTKAEWVTLLKEATALDAKGFLQNAF